MITNITEITDSNAPEVRLRIHIAPVGYEEDRIVLPAKKMRAEKMILIANDPKQEKASRFYTKVKDRLAQEGIEYELINSPFFSLEENLQLFSTLFRKYRNQEIFVNISSGSKIQALAGFVSAMISKTEGINVVIYYAEPERYREDPPESPISSGCKRILDIPIYPLFLPSKEIRFSMNLLRKKPLSKIKLAIKLAQAGYLDNKLLSEDDESPADEKARVSLQNLVDNRVIQPMLRERYAETEKVGRNILVRLSKMGLEATRLFVLPE